MIDYLRRFGTGEGARWPLVAACVVAGTAVALALLAAYGLVTDDDNVATVSSLNIALPAEWNEAALTRDDRAAGVIYRADHAEPDASVVVRTVTGALPETFNIEALAADTEAALAAEVDGFELVSRSIGTLAGNDAISIVYRHDTEEQSRMVILPKANQTYYGVLTSASSDFAAIEEDSAAIFESIAQDLD